MKSHAGKAATSLLCATAMTMAVTAGVIAHLGEAAGLTDTPAVEFWTTFLATGINIFVITTGYAGLRLTWTRVATLVLLVLVSGLCATAAAALTEPDSIPPGSLWRQVLFPVSSMPCGAVHNYLFLLLLSPLLNRGMRALSHVQARTAVIILTAAMLGSGWIGQNNMADTSMTIFSFIYFYILGQYLRRDRPFDRLSTPLLGLIITGTVILLAAMVWGRSALSGNHTLYLGPEMGNTLPGLIFSATAVSAAMRWRTRWRGATLTAVSALGFYIFCCRLDLPMLVERLAADGAGAAGATVLCLAAMWVAAIIITAISLPPVRAVARLVERKARSMRPFGGAGLYPRPVSGTERQAIRNSAIETVRIVAMSMILIRHYFDHAIGDAPVTFPAGIILTGFLLVRVNLYILISGYMGLRLTWRSLLGLATTVLMFNIVNILLLRAAGDTTMTVRDIAYGLIFPISKGNYWFLCDYLFLMLLSPVVNKALAAMDLRRLRIMVAVLAFAGFYCGWLGGSPVTGNETGFTFMLSLYIAGYWAAREKWLHEVNRWWLLGVYVATSVFNIIAELSYIHWFGESSDLFSEWKNISVTTVIGSIALMLFIVRRTFHNRLVNMLGIASLGCYLLQDGWFGHYWFYPLQHDFYVAHGETIASLAMFAASFAATWAASVILTWFKRLWSPWLVGNIVNLLPSGWKRDVW